MSISAAERRFIRNWEEQRKGGKASFVAIYTFGYTIIIFMTGIAIGLFTGLRFVTLPLLSAMGLTSLVAGIALAFYQYSRSQKKFRNIIQREIAEGESV
jgi:small-conductance mechanosensitive channel